MKLKLLKPTGSQTSSGRCFGIIDRQVRAMTRLVEDVLDRFEVRLGHLYHSSDLLRPRREAV